MSTENTITKIQHVCFISSSQLTQNPEEPAQPYWEQVEGIGVVPYHHRKNFIWSPK